MRLHHLLDSCTGPVYRIYFIATESKIKHILVLLPSKGWSPSGLIGQTSNRIRQTILPEVRVEMIELLGNTVSFKILGNVIGFLIKASGDEVSVVSVKLLASQ